MLGNWGPAAPPRKSATDNKERGGLQQHAAGGSGPIMVSAVLIWSMLCCSAGSAATTTNHLRSSGSSFTVHPFPGGGTLASPWYSVHVGAASGAQPSFVWYTANSKRQPIAPHNNVPSMSSKDTSFTSFDLSRPTPVTVQFLNATGIEHAAVLPSRAGIVTTVAAGGRTVSFTIDRPRQICLIVNQNMDAPLCIFADPPEVNPPTGPSENLIYFGPGVHRVAGNAINVTANQSVYLAGGAHVYGQVRAVGVTWSGFWVGGEPCDNVRVFGRGVLDGHDIPINFAAHAMIELPACSNIRVEGITAIDAPQYQLNNLNPGAVVNWSKAIAWGFSTDGWSGGEHSLISDCFQKVNDDSTKLYSTGAVVQRGVVWQMENGTSCALCAPRCHPRPQPPVLESALTC